MLGHPGGPFWSRKDTGVWSIPKGLVEAGENPLSAALREFGEETGHYPSGDAISLGVAKQPGGKIVHAWAMLGDLDVATLKSNSFEMEWPPKSGRRQSFPEIDRIAYFTLPAATIKILAYQQPLLLELQKRIAS